MKILHVSEIDLNRKKDVGVLKKTIAQMKTFQNYNYHVNFLMYKDKEPILFELPKIDEKELKTLEYFKKRSNLKRKNRISLIKVLKQIAHEYDLLYIRFFVPDPFFMKFIEKNNRILKILEIPTEISAVKKEIKINQKGIKKLLGLFFIKTFFCRLLNESDCIVSISNKNNVNQDNKLISIENGVYLEDLKVKKDIKENLNRLCLLSIANNQYWHGYDRIIKGLHEYYKTDPEKEFFYHCVGEGAELTNLKNLTKELNLEKYVIFHGTKTGEDLDKVVDECDIAFGSLGNHRKGLYADSALKNREYCARGIPFVIASDDQDFPETFPFVYRIPKDDSPVDINQVIKWYENLIKEHPNYSIEMRKYAEENLSWDAKMKPVIEKIKELAKEKERKPTT